MTVRAPTFLVGQEMVKDSNFCRARMALPSERLFGGLVLIE